MASEHSIPLQPWTWRMKYISVLQALMDAPGVSTHGGEARVGMPTSLAWLAAVFPCKSELPHAFRPG